ncbi:MAG: hypothetical protein KAQ83_03130, partial [Nanoarchaeota archaeon]|nr:hypothetical protein [Nanoarchaeota archaeon]
VVSDVNIAKLENLASLVVGPKKLVVGIYTPITNSMSGNILMMLEKKDAILLSNEILSIKKRDEDLLTQKDLKNLKIVGNLVSEYYIKSLNKFLGLNMCHGKTNIVTTFGESIMDIIMLNMGSNAQDVLMINAHFDIDKTEIKGHFTLLLAVESMEVLLNALRKNFV